MIKAKTVAMFVFLSAKVFADDVPNFPADWGQVSKQVISGTNCPSLNGVFAELALTFRMVNGTEDTNFLTDNDSYRILHDNETRFKRVDLSSDGYTNSFSIKQDTKTSFILTRYDKLYWKDVVSTEVSGRDKLTCNNGWWTIVTDDTGRKATEGHTYRMQFDRGFTRLDNNDLVVHVRYIHERTDWFILKDTRVEDTYYRYRFLRDSMGTK